MSLIFNIHAITDIFFCTLIVNLPVSPSEKGIRTQDQEPKTTKVFTPQVPSVSIP